MLAMWLVETCWSNPLPTLSVDGLYQLCLVCASLARRYFVGIDMVMLTQYLYYSALNSRIKKMRQYSRSRGMSATAASGDLHGAYHPLPTSDAPEVVRYKPRHASEVR